MTAQEIRKKYLEFFGQRGHKVIPRASLVPQDDPTTLFTGSGMQPLVPYLLGEKHPDGNRLVDSQACFRAEDMDEVGDNRHTTFFEMLGNWSLGDYFKKEQIPWFWEFLTEELKLPKDRLWATCFKGDERLGIPNDTESAEIWEKMGIPKERIVFYGAEYNWWSREGEPSHMREGEPGGPDSEIFYDFGTPHDKKYGESCHPNCDCGRFLEIGNSVFMTYRKVGNKFEHLPKPNVDFGGGLERLEAATRDNPDIFQISLIKPVIDGLEKLSGKKYTEHKQSMRVIADHMRAASWLAIDGVMPSNKTQGYVLRRLLRRAIRYGLEIGLETELCERVAPIVLEIYATDFAEVEGRKSDIVAIFAKEEKLFRQTLRHGLKEFDKILGSPISWRTHHGGIVYDTKAMQRGEVDKDFKKIIDGHEIFKLYDTYGFPKELTIEEAGRRGIEVVHLDQFDNDLEEQRYRSQTASQGMFKGGLADHSEQVIRLHTATHLMYQALKDVLGDHVVQRGSNITSERIRFDFSHPEKMTGEQIAEVEEIVNEKIAEDLPITWKEEKTEGALKTASGAFGDKYGDRVKVYTIGDPSDPFSREICGGPHVEHTGQIGEGGKHFKIVKEESSSAGVRRIKAVLQ